MTLHEQIRAFPGTGVDSALDQIGSASGVPWDVPVDVRGPTSAELRKLASDDLATTDAHTNLHMGLVQHPQPAQLEAIAASETDLERLLGYPVKHFAYPYGRADGFDATSINAERRAAFEPAFETACSSTQGSVHPDADGLELPRPIVKDWGRSGFRAQMCVGGVW
jgi:peptidoglycan/xylan/chitin deacetylase (PgdA/CDA1 family)